MKGIETSQNQDWMVETVSGGEESIDFSESVKYQFYGSNISKKYFSEIFREAQGSLWEVSGTCSEMFGESVKIKILGLIFF